MKKLFLFLVFAMAMFSCAEDDAPVISDSNALEIAKAVEQQDTADCSKTLAALQEYNNELLK